MKAIFFNIPADGHVNPSLPLVAELVSRGEEVLYYNMAASRARVEATGAAFRPYQREEVFEPNAGAAGPFQAMAQILSFGETQLGTLLAESRREAPHYVVYDSMAPWGKQIAQILGVPAICSCSILYVGRRNFRALPRHILPVSELLRSLPNILCSMWRYRQIARRIYRRYGVSSPPPQDFFGNPGDITIVYTSRYFQIGADLLDDSFKFVGPSLAPRQNQDGFPFEHLEGGPVIYVSLGTIFNERPAFFRNCIDAFGNSPYRVVLSVGSKVAPEALGPIPANVLVRSHVPQLDILRRADLFITHGGMNSVSESAWYGVPMLVVPQVGDQLFIAQQVVALGAGLCLQPQHATAHSLRSTAEQILQQESFRRQSARIGESFRQSGGYQRAVDEIQIFLRSYRPNHPPSTGITAPCT